MYFSYYKQADRRDRAMAEEISKNFDCSHYSDLHLSNALKFAKGCAGSESLARQRKLQEEIRRRKNKRI